MGVLKVGVLDVESKLFAPRKEVGGGSSLLIVWYCAMEARFTGKCVSAFLVHFNAGYSRLTSMKELLR